MQIQYPVENEHLAPLHIELRQDQDANFGTLSASEGALMNLMRFFLQGTGRGKFGVNTISLGVFLYFNKLNTISL